MVRILCLALMTVAGAALAQVNVQVNLPSIVFPAPPALVVVQPGVQVVPDYEEEVFFVDGYYWHRRGPQWFRTKSHGGGWVLVESGVPTALVAIPRGKYSRWHGARAVAPGRWKKHGKWH